jgi:hypothetical protein
MTARPNGQGQLDFGAAERAAAAVAANPGKSDRAIAADLGVGSNTVRRARKTTAPHGAVKRIGKDGKARRLPLRPQTEATGPLHQKTFAVPIRSRSRWRDAIANGVAFVAALGLAGVSASFAIIGLTNIFAGAFWPIIAMGCALECGKLASVAWLGRKYSAPLPIKVAIGSLIVVLVALNAVGAYGFLAHAHLEHAAAGEVQIGAAGADVSARLKVQAAVLADLDKRIGQVDAAVDEAVKRGRVSGGMEIAEQQRRYRSDLVAQRRHEANALAELQVAAAGVQGKRLELAVDSGPVHYLASLVGAGDESVMRFFVLIVAVLLDPFAVLLFLAATVARGQS